MMDERLAVSLGAIPRHDGVHFCVWAPQAKALDVVYDGTSARRVRLQASAAGYWEGVDPLGKAGMRYRFHVAGQDAYPDPASRYQPEGPHGSSEIVDPSLFAWTDRPWTGLNTMDLVVYELHIGAFTPEGTFRAAVSKLPYLKALGVTAIELMPVAECAGRRNWGYDGVNIFAPSHHYGTPEDLRGFVDEAHRLGLGVVLDVVYNHFGPDGNYLGAFSRDYFTERHHTPWGAAVNLDGDHAAEARRFFIENALYWIRDFHIDGLRLDATHALIDDSPHHFLQQLREQIRREGSRYPIWVAAEDARNWTRLIETPERNGFGLDAVWSDDFHHEVRRSLAGDHEGYFQDFSGTLHELARTIQQGWYYTGQRAASTGAARGSDPAGLRKEQFVFCLQNHDQIGNRAFGERLHHQIDAASYRAASALLLTVPETPLLFMGQEWAASSPFLYFTDHHDALGRLVTEGRRNEFREFSLFREAERREQIPDPQASETFLKSKLAWDEQDRPEHAFVLRLYRKLLAWRHERYAPLASSLSLSVRPLPNDGLWLDYRLGSQQKFWIFFEWKGSARHELASMYRADGWRLLFSTEDTEVCPDPRPVGIYKTESHWITEFQRPGAIVIEWDR